MQASDPKQSWWMTITEGPKTTNPTPKSHTRGSEIKIEATGGDAGYHGRPREDTGGREATGGHGRTEGHGRTWEDTGGLGGHGKPRKATGGPRGPWRPQRPVPAHRFGPGSPNLVL